MSLMTQAIGLISAVSLLGAADLVQLQADGFTVVSDRGEASARNLIDRALEVRLAFPAEFSATLKIVVLGTGDRFARVRPTAGATAFFERTSAGGRIVVSDPRSERAFRHEYVHFALDHSAVALPLWLEEGLAEYYSTLRVERDLLVAGEPIPEHLAWLQKNGVPPLAGLLSSGPEGVTGPALYATSWALVHMLRSAPRYKERYGAFWNRLQLGERVEALLPEVFGRTLAQLAGDLTAYAAAPALPREHVPVGERIRALPRVEATALTEEAFEEEYLGLLRAMGRWEESWRRLEKSARPGAKPLARAMRALAERRFSEARREMELALDAGLESGELWLEYAGVLRDTEAEEVKVAAALRRALEWNSRLVPAQVWLAALEGKQANWRQAEQLLERASTLAPRRFDIWYELAFARRALQARTAALAAATRAFAVAASELDREKAAALRESLAQAVPAPALRLCARKRFRVGTAGGRPDAGRRVARTGVRGAGGDEAANGRGAARTADPRSGEGDAAQHGDAEL